jgi:hypothetical protein
LVVLGLLGRLLELLETVQEEVKLFLLVFKD